MKNQHLTKRFMRAAVMIFSIALALSVCCPAVNAKSSTMKLSDGTVFDPVFYAERYPDVVEALGNDAKALANHYLQYGKAEGRLPAATASAKTMTLADGSVFDPEYYAAQYPEIAAALGTDPAVLADDYLKIGKAAGRLPYAGASDVCPERILALINQKRQEAKVENVTADATLNQIAQLRADEMAKTGVFSHTRPNGTSFKTAYQDKDGKWKLSLTKASENLGRMKPNKNASQLIQSWKDSPKHNKTMISAAYKRIGIGIATASDGRIYIATEYAD